MHRYFLVASALLFAGIAIAQDNRRPDPRDPAAKAPRVEFQSAFEGYRPFAEQDLRDWRKANDEVGAAGGHMGHRPGQGAQTSKPQPGKPESSGGPAEKGKSAPAQQGHGGHK